ncbi:MAG: hypothetical protein A2040_02700 [Rhodocyclales bacterium GWA2_65_19]|nr:MAG: hypothetical protein A2040_02700 [Rhodocyclales bacterium GWA2_65_19]
MTYSLLSKIGVAGLICCAAGAIAQVSVKTPGQVVQVGKGGDVRVRAEGVTAIATEGNKASVTVGGIDGDADIQGVTVINGRVSIDGKDIPAGVTRYKSPRTGTVYLIQRRGGSVNVTTEEGAGK